MSEDNRRSTAAQFFEEEEEEEMEASKPEPKSTSTYDRVVELLNNASLMQKDSMKISLLKQVQEFIIHKEANLLDNFLDEMIAFQSDRSMDVRKYIVGFMEEACKKEPELLFKVLPSLMLMLNDENINVQKRVMLSMAQLYRITLQWLSTSKGISSEMTLVWDKINAMKGIIFEMLDSENDGVRTHVVKFLEGVVLILTSKTKESEVPKKQENDFTIDDIKESNRYIKIKKLEEEAKNSMDALLHFQASAHISSINLMTVMGALSNIAKQRPVYFSRVVQAFEALHVNLPPTLAKSQVSSVRKNLKMHMLALLKHSMSVDFIPQITTLLTDLGATHNEIQKVMPKIDESKKRKAEETTSSTKKLKIEEMQTSRTNMRANSMTSSFHSPNSVEEHKSKPENRFLIDLDDDDIGMTPFVKRGERKPATAAQRQTAIDITAEDILDKLSPQNVADLVLISMVMLPDNMPAQFQATYTPIAAAGTDAQVKHLARLLATQLTTAGMGKGILSIQHKALDMDIVEEEEGGDVTPLPPSPKQLIQTLVGGTTLQALDTKEVPSSQIMMPPAAAPRKGIKQFKLSAVTHQLDRDTLDQMTTQTFKRILHAEKTATAGNALANRVKILASLVCQFGGELKDLLQEYIFEDLRNRSDIAFSWLYQEYANCRGFSASTIAGEKTTLASYDECLTRLLSGLLDRPDHREGLFTRLILESPVITDNAMQVLKKYCMDENRVTTGMYTLRDLVLTRPAHRLRYLDVLLEFVSVEKQEVRTAAIRTVKKLYERQSLKEAIENYSMKCLKNLLKPKPPPEMFPNIRAKQDIPDAWSEEAIKMCLYLYLGLLPSNHRMIHELAIVYTATSADIKRTILRVLETPVKGMGMDSPELLLLVENCPKGAETLVTRIIHILTDKAAPSPELVERVRDLYHKRVSDVRFLIPVLTGLHKKEVIAALPKLIKLNPVVVKEVFNRLLGGHGDGGATYTSPLNPAELLISLHNIDANKCDMKTIIKATNLCFAEKVVYTQEVLAVVMQQLMEQNPLPTLFMRTVLQSLSMCPRLIGFVLNILQRLIIKQVWKQKKVWEGFIKCCQRTKPQSFQVLLQLPASQLKNVFEVSPELREPLLNQVNSFTPHQRAHIPKSIITVLEKDPAQEQKQAEAAAAAAAAAAALKADDFVTMTSTPVIIDLLPEDSEPVPPGLETTPSNVLIPLSEIKKEPTDEIEKPKAIISIPIKREKLPNFPTTPVDLSLDTNVISVHVKSESMDLGLNSSQSDADISMTSGPEPGELILEEMGSQDSESVQLSQEDGKNTAKRKDMETSPRSKDAAKRLKKKSSSSSSEPVRRSTRSRKI